MKTRKPHPSDVSDEERSFVMSYLALVREGSEQRRDGLREVFNAPRLLITCGAPWHMLPNDLPPWEAIYQQTRRRMRAGCFEAIVE